MNFQIAFTVRLVLIAFEMNIRSMPERRRLGGDHRHVHYLQSITYIVIGCRVRVELWVALKQPLSSNGVSK